MRFSRKLAADRTTQGRSRGNYQAEPPRVQKLTRMLHGCAASQSRKTTCQILRGPPDRSHTVKVEQLAPSTRRGYVQLDKLTDCFSRIIARKDSNYPMEVKSISRAHESSSSKPWDLSDSFLRFSISKAS